MRKRSFGFLLGLLAIAATASAFQVNAVIRKVDAEQRVLVVIGGNREHTVKVANDAKLLDEQGKPLADGLKSRELKEGAAVTLTLERGTDPEPVVKELQLGHKAAPQGTPQSAPAMTGKPSVGLKPLNEMTADDHYKGEDGGLYGAGKNTPPDALAVAAKSETVKIIPLDAEGKPSLSGTIVLVSISMSNATQEFSYFKREADADKDKAPKLTIVDCAQGGQAMAQWVSPDARPWSVAEQRLTAANVTNQQVQIAWVKLANVHPTGELSEHGRKLEKDTIAVVQNAKAKFPNLRIVYLGSRIYGGYATTPLNPEPYAYEGAFAVRWLIQDQMKGEPGLNFDPAKGAVKAPLLLWGPYFWGDGMTPRKIDGLIWERSDLGPDGTHPSESGRKKVSDQLLKFFKTDEDARTWFVRKG